MAASPTPGARQPGARFALLTLSAINMLNFADRYVPSAVKQPLQDELGLSDVETALPTMGMVLVYMVTAPVFGILADKDVVDRRYLLAGAVMFWSAATAVAGFARNLMQLVLLRSLVGVGEAAYMAIALPLISDFFPLEERTAAYMVFTLAMPLGGALGFGAGAVLAAAFGWRVAFFACGIPGLVVALSVLLMEDPVKGINDRQLDAEKLEDEEFLDDAGCSKHTLQPSWFGEVGQIITNWQWLCATLGMTSASFSIGGFAEWYDIYLLRYTGLSLATAGLVLAASTAFGGIFGSIMGSHVAQAFQSRWKSANFVVPALFTIPGAVFAIGAVNLVIHPYVAILCVILGELCIFTHGPPLTTVSISVMPVHLRARSAGLQIFITHILGDLISPPIFGAISDHLGSLQLAMQLTWIAIAMAGFWWWVGYRFLDPLPTSMRQNNHQGTGLFSLLCGCVGDDAQEDVCGLGKMPARAIGAGEGDQM